MLILTVNIVNIVNINNINLYSSKAFKQDPTWAYCDEFGQVQLRPIKANYPINRWD